MDKEKIIMLSLVLLLGSSCILIYDHLREEEPLKIDYNNKTIIPLYYDLDNPEKPMVLDDGKYVEVTING